MSKLIATTKHLNEALEMRYAWPGGYPTYFVTADGAALCHACTGGDCKEDVIHAIEHQDDRSGWNTVALDVNWEDSFLVCDHCGEHIESAYAE